MKIGKPLRTRIVEPLEDPVPASTPPQERREEREPEQLPVESGRPA